MVEDKIKIAPLKGRPMLKWVGKKPLDLVKSFPAQLVETFDPTGKAEQIENPTFDKLKDKWQNLLFHGDNKEVLGFLLANGFRGKVDLIYIDPPFDSGANYVRKVGLRGTKEKVQIEGEDYTIGEQIQYYDIWANDAYLQWMYERLILLKELLSEKGTIFVHLSHHKSHYLKIILDEIFGEQYFQDEIVWVCGRTGAGHTTMPVAHNTILRYTKSSKFTYNKPTVPFTEDEIKSFKKDEKGYYYQRGGAQRELKEWEKEKYLRTYVNLQKGKTIDNVWDDVGSYSLGLEKQNYPTQKPEALLKRIINMSSDDNTLVLDCFIGSGTTAAVAQERGIRWIGVDINKGAIQITSKRLQETIKQKIKEEKNNDKQKKLLENKKQFLKHYSFAHYKVNDYDLQLLRTEAIELAIQHIGIQRTKTDQFFEGTLGKNLVKIIDFNHPLKLLDIQLVQDELKKRPDENRNIIIVCLGKELSIDPWLEDYNKKHPINKLEVVELRTDKKYGKFLIHKLDKATVNIKRKDNKAIIEIKDFISPSIIERLNDPEQLVKIKISDFRSMIDVVLVDNDYNGKVFNIAYSDVPEKKHDMVEGRYEIGITNKKTTIAVKVIDMLGEEVLIAKEI